FVGVAVVLDDAYEAIDVDAEAATARAGAAVALPVLARRCAALGLSGLEFFVGIPGSVGGAVRMNAGGHGRETADVLLRARVVRLLPTGAAGPRELRDAPRLGLGYRRSALAPTELVLQAEFVVGAGT